MRRVVLTAAALRQSAWENAAVLLRLAAAATASWALARWRGPAGRGRVLRRLLGRRPLAHGHQVGCSARGETGQGEERESATIRHVCNLAAVRCILPVATSEPRLHRSRRTNERDRNAAGNDEQEDLELRARRERQDTTLDGSVKARLAMPPAAAPSEPAAISDGAPSRSAAQPQARARPSSRVQRSAWEVAFVVAATLAVDARGAARLDTPLCKRTGAPHGLYGGLKTARRGGGRAGRRAAERQR